MVLRDSIPKGTNEETHSITKIHVCNDHKLEMADDKDTTASFYVCKIQHHIVQHLIGMERTTSFTEMKKDLE